MSDSEVKRLLDIRLIELPLDKNSMLYWWPRLAKKIAEGKLDIPHPETRIIPFPERTKLAHIAMFADCVEERFGEVCDEIDGIIKELTAVTRKVITDAGLSYPVFLRTDHRSYKNRTHVREPEDPVYKVKNGEELGRKIAILLYYSSEDMFYNIINGLVERAPRAVVVREWIEPATWIEFKEPRMARKPYNRVEARAIVRNGQMKMLFPYYHISGMLQHHLNDVEDWSYVMEAYRNNYARLVIESLQTLKSYAEAIGRVVKGSWSVDFMLGRDGKWYFIDMALERDSWKPPKYEELEPEARKILGRLGSLGEVVHG